MAENSNIEWCDHTFNPWEGCQKVGPGCDHCYAENRNARFAGGTAVNWGPGAPRRRTSAANWRKPLQWNESPFYRCACGWRGSNAKPWRDIGICCPACEGRLYPARARVFCASLADVFDNEVDPAWRADLFDLIKRTPNLDWLILTKRIGNVQRMVADVIRHSAVAHGQLDWPMANVWLGATVVNQAEADRDIPKLLDVPASVRFLSIEPMLGPIWLNDHLYRNLRPTGDLRTHHGKRQMKLVHDGARGDLHWVIVGGESGPDARPMSPDWARSLRDQCKATGVPFLFKQWGEWIPMLGQAEGISVRPEKATTPDGWMMGWAGKKAAGRLLDGIEHNGFPEAG